MRTKYQLRPQNLNGEIVSFDWISDSDIDLLLRLKTGKPISLVTAAELFYDSSIREDLSVDHQILDLGIVGYALSCGYRIDILQEIEDFTSLYVLLSRYHK